MLTRCRPVAALFLAGVLLVACGDDNAPASPDASETSATVGTNIDCDKLKDTLADLSVNWQVIIGLANVPTTEWATVSQGVEDFDAQLAIAGAALGKNLQAAGALKYMAEANVIVKRGLDGDTTAQADLATLLGPDTTVSVNKQIPIVLAYNQAGCN